MVYFNSVHICGALWCNLLQFLISTLAAKHIYAGKTLTAYMPESLCQVCTKY